MTFTFYVVDERQMPPESAGDALVTPEAMVVAIRTRGGRWSVVKASVDRFADAFEALDRFIGNKGFLSELAFHGSPDHLLAGHPGAWTLGYFEASLVHHLCGAFRLQSAEMEEALRDKPEPVQSIYEGFLSALEEADERGFAVAILHG